MATKETTVVSAIEATAGTVIPEASQPAVVPATSPSLIRRIPRPIAVVLFAALTAGGAYAAVPLGFTPVPMTLQTLVVLMAGVVLGPVGGALSQLTYLGAGILGGPVFSTGAGGLAWVFGATGGYLMAFPMAAAIAGWGVGRTKGILGTALVLVVSTAVIFVMGYAWLAAVTDWDGETLFAMGVQPFLVGAVLKVAIALVLTRLFVSRTN